LSLDIIKKGGFRPPLLFMGVNKKAGVCPLDVLL
jgi:hypothetical protein